MDPYEEERERLKRQYRGVFWDKKTRRWRCQLGYQSKKIFLGYFDDAGEAAKAYDTKLVELRGAAARTNFPITDYLHLLQAQAQQLDAAAAAAATRQQQQQPMAGLPRNDFMAMLPDLPDAQAQLQHALALQQHQQQHQQAAHSEERQRRAGNGLMDDASMGGVGQRGPRVGYEALGMGYAVGGGEQDEQQQQQDEQQEQQQQQQEHQAGVAPGDAEDEMTKLALQQALHQQLQQQIQAQIQAQLAAQQANMQAQQQAAGQQLPSSLPLLNLPYDLNALSAPQQQQMYDLNTIASMLQPQLNLQQGLHAQQMGQQPYAANQQQHQAAAIAAAVAAAAAAATDNADRALADVSAWTQQGAPRVDGGRASSGGGGMEYDGGQEAQQSVQVGVPFRTKKRGARDRDAPENLEEEAAHSFRGVFWDKKSRRWRCQLGFKNKKIFLGYFHDAEEAARAYDAKLVELHGSAAKTNFPVSDYLGIGGALSNMPSLPNAPHGSGHRGSNDGTGMDDDGTGDLNPGGNLGPDPTPSEQLAESLGYLARGYHGNLAAAAAKAGGLEWQGAQGELAMEEAAQQQGQQGEEGDEDHDEATAAAKRRRLGHLPPEQRPKGLGSGVAAGAMGGGFASPFLQQASGGSGGLQGMGSGEGVAAYGGRISEDGQLARVSSGGHRVVETANAAPNATNRGNANTRLPPLAPADPSTAFTSGRPPVSPAMGMASSAIPSGFAGLASLPGNDLSKMASGEVRAVQTLTGLSNAPDAATAGVRGVGLSWPASGAPASGGLGVSVSAPHLGNVSGAMGTFSSGPGAYGEQLPGGATGAAAKVQPGDLASLQQAAGQALSAAGFGRPNAVPSVTGGTGAGNQGLLNRLGSSEMRAAQTLTGILGGGQGAGGGSAGNGMHLSGMASGEVRAVQTLTGLSTGTEGAGSDRGQQLGWGSGSGQPGSHTRLEVAPLSMGGGDGDVLPLPRPLDSGLGQQLYGGDAGGWEGHPGYGGTLEEHGVATGARRPRSKRPSATGGGARAEHDTDAGANTAAVSEAAALLLQSLPGGGDASAGGGAGQSAVGGLMGSILAAADGSGSAGLDASGFDLQNLNLTDAQLQAVVGAAMAAQQQQQSAGLSAAAHGGDGTEQGQYGAGVEAVAGVDGAQGGAGLPPLSEFVDALATSAAQAVAENEAGAPMQQQM